MMALTPDQEKLKEAALAATPGPWQANGSDVFAGSRYRLCSNITAGGSSKGMVDQIQWQQANATHIALANPAAILAILAQLEQVRGWQPIETAPQGPILLLAAEFDRPGDWRIKCGGFWEGAWEVFGASWTPTRWQTLPPPPEAA